MRDMTVGDVMTRLFVALKPDDSIHYAAGRLARNHISGAPVVEASRVVGVISESDILRAALPPRRDGKLYTLIEFLSEIAREASHQRLRTVTVADVMNSPAITVRQGSSIWEAATLMERHNVKRLPVVEDDDVLVGVVSRADLVRVMGRSDDAIREDVLEAISVLGEDELRDAVVMVKHGVLTLAGKVVRRSTKRLAREIGRRTPGIIDVVDELDYEFDDEAARERMAGDPWAHGPLIRNG